MFTNLTHRSRSSFNLSLCCDRSFVIANSSFTCFWSLRSFSLTDFPPFSVNSLHHKSHGIVIISVSVHFITMHISRTVCIIRKRVYTTYRLKQRDYPQHPNLPVNLPQSSRQQDVLVSRSQWILFQILESRHRRDRLIHPLQWM